MSHSEHDSVAHNLLDANSRFASPSTALSGCGSPAHWGRRTFLRAAAGVAGAWWWTRLAESLARAEEQSPAGKTPRSVIMLWLQGGPSQLETFDPHPGKSIGGSVKAIKTSAPGVEIAEFYPRTAERMHLVSLVRSVVSKEGDHERATYQGKTGFRPDPTLVHPSLGAIMCHQLKDNLEIPRHISIFPGEAGARGGYLGDRYDAFRTDDPVGPLPDVRARVPDERFKKRLDDLQAVVEPQFARGRFRKLDEDRTLHLTSIRAAQRMMSSDQLKAFNVSEAPRALRDEFGDTRFGRGCLAAARLVKVGVRCVEVTLPGWDTHAANHEGHRTQAEILDPALAALLRLLEEEQLLDQTIVVCGGEFGRTPRINPVGGRDHWPHGFTLMLAGGGFGGGRVIGATSPDPKGLDKPASEDVVDPYGVADIHATILHRLGVDFQAEHSTPIGRPMRFSDGKVIPAFA
ncbi:MAG: DUF1501 domain-containing protein [Pirellulales bacterium]